MLMFLFVLIPLAAGATCIFALSRLGRKQQSIKGKVVVISGASSGLGEALSRRFHSAGAKLILLARSVDKLEQLAKDMDASGLSDYPVKFVRFDLADEIGHDFAGQLASMHGGVDLLINNAGMSYRGTIADTSMKVHRQMMEVNYFGHVALTTALLPELRKSKGGVIAISSIQGRVAIPFRSAYSASKHAFQAFFDTLRAEEHATLGVLVVSPGYIRTNLSLNAMTSSGDQHGKMDKTTAKGMAPDKLADMILYGYCRGEQEITWRKEGVFLRALMPALYFRLMNRRAIKKEGI